MYLGAAPLGHTRGRGKRLTTVVGVVKDIVQEATDGKRHPIVFRPLAQADEYNEHTKQQLIVRTTDSIERLEARIRAEFRRSRHNRRRRRSVLWSRRWPSASPLASSHWCCSSRSPRSRAGSPSSVSTACCRIWWPSARGRSASASPSARIPLA